MSMPRVYCSVGNDISVKILIVNTAITMTGFGRNARRREHVFWGACRRRSSAAGQKRTTLEWRNIQVIWARDSAGSVGLMLGYSPTNRSNRLRKK
jgi:hypothetical protein